MSQSAKGVTRRAVRSRKGRQNSGSTPQDPTSVSASLDGSETKRKSKMALSMMLESPEEGQSGGNEEEVVHERKRRVAKKTTANSRSNNDKKRVKTARPGPPMKRKYKAEVAPALSQQPIVKSNFDDIDAHESVKLGITNLSNGWSRRFSNTQQEEYYHHPFFKSHWVLPEELKNFPPAPAPPTPPPNDDELLGRDIVFTSSEEKAKSVRSGGDDVSCLSFRGKPGE